MTIVIWSGHEDHASGAVQSSMSQGNVTYDLHRTGELAQKIVRGFFRWHELRHRTALFCDDHRLTGGLDIIHHPAVGRPGGVGSVALILLDTHVVVWAAMEPQRLSRADESALLRARRSGGLAMASISLWEMASLFAQRRIEAYGTIDASIRQVLETVGVIEKPITQEIAVLATGKLSARSSRQADRRNCPGGRTRPDHAR